MKNFIMKSLKKRMAVPVILLVTFLSASFTSMAAEGKQGPDPKNYTVKYVGESQNGLVFNFKYQNPDAGKVQLILKSQDGTILFQNAFSEKELDQNIVLTRDTDMDHVTFIIKANKNQIVQNFTIKTKTVQIVDVQEAD